MILTTFGVAFVIALGQNQFPATVLDSIPAVRWDSLTAPEYVLTDAPSLPGKVVRDLVLVGFYESISPAARRAAIASVNGCRLGNVLDVYVIRIPYILRRGDSTSGPLLRAIERLKRNHIVELAMVEQLDVPVTTSGRPGSSTTSRVVPARPPLGTTRAVMDSAHASDNLLASVPGIAGRTTRNTLYVRFVHNATPAQKDSALAAIDAQVIGGIYYASYGWYYVRLRNTATAPPDSAYGPLLRAERKLHSLRYVQSVMHDLVDSPIQPRSSGSVTLAPPHYFPKALFDSLGSVRGRPLSNRPYRRSIVAVEFDLRAPVAARQAAIDSIGGIVVGGQRYLTGQVDEGTYYVRIPGTTTAALLGAVQTLDRQPQIALATWWALFRENEQAYRGPVTQRPPLARAHLLHFPP